MKKKSLVTMLAALALVGSVGVGATLAYFTAQTDTLENKFVFNKNGIKLGLEEIVEDGQIIPAGEDYQYEDLVPGAVVDKMPYVTMPDGSVPAYVFLKVDVIGTDSVPADKLTITGYDTTQWMEVTSKVAAEGDTAKYYVYVKDAEEGSFAVVYPNGDKEGVTKTEPVFTNVKIASDLTGEEEALPVIVIDAAAVQAFEGETEVATDVALEAVKDLF